MKVEMMISIPFVDGLIEDVFHLPRDAPRGAASLRLFSSLKSAFTWGILSTVIIRFQRVCPGPALQWLCPFTSYGRKSQLNNRHQPLNQHMKDVKPIMKRSGSPTSKTPVRHRRGIVDYELTAIDGPSGV
ncbi:hypothetical protein PAAG_11041 [Paracoccidioides lutzii Pb01]|uniref:Uncharacterized protein n=1 Tax=Paracoccidioides lutzii (strain ATCC MYA-826 / Pb01) TaxID=502779 RepID=A0A0A2V6Y8_PARBA|nr:hypothetical protein PAAG_11041 [Paracoccidioides lutzii Pb01]KGQ02092.1 hypothetical protein PAAG_11041 [Paracoccidioides lutzii Pb01]